MSKLLVKSIYSRIINLLKITFIFYLSFSANATTIKVGLVEYPPHLDFKNTLNESKLFQYTNAVFKKHDLKVDFVGPRNEQNVDGS